MNLNEEILNILTVLTNGRKINSDTSIVESGILDSASILELINMLEDKFDFYFDEQELILENFETVNKIEGIIIKKISSKNS
ncbi:MAG: hypothetical protein HQK91_03045 [Nitrospirae bacterium]|nr:hypothetical protein [Nitrospirota bacterium]MBF0540413.1 hypothetical protein [Nitrospirota bacterium]